LPAAVRVIAAPLEEPAAGVVLCVLEEDELVIDEPPQPATRRARAVSDSAAAGRRGKDMAGLLS
jgi:hypothetical protein